MPRKAPTQAGLSAVADLERITELRQELDEMELKAVTKARRGGVSWYKIGPALGTSHQAAHEKFRYKVGT